MAKEKKSRFPSVLLWGGIGVAILLLGVGSALFYLNRGQVGSGEGLSAIQNIMEMLSLGDKPEALAPAPGAPGEAPEGEEAGEAPPRTYTVKEGENLWTIAKRGELVDSPWQWRTIVTQNKDKIDYTFVSQDTGDWKVMVAKGKQLTVRDEPPPEPGRAVKKKFALQLLSAPEANLERALKIVKMLLADGYYAYLYRIEVGGQQYYRVRAGFYETKQSAQEAGVEIQKRYADKKIFREKFMVFLPSFREMRGERLDFGVQKSNPWVIEFPRRESHKAALADLKKVSPASDFTYIAQKKDPASGMFYYRTRIGFFPTAATAQELIQQQGAGGGLWREAKVTALETLEEALPGQRVRVKPPRS